MRNSQAADTGVLLDAPFWRSGAAERVSFSSDVTLWSSFSDWRCANDLDWEKLNPAMGMKLGIGKCLTEKGYDIHLAFNLWPA
jgi:hypothetical protein